MRPQPSNKSRYFVIDNNGDGAPCIVARYQDGRTVIVATMTNTEQSHEHAENLCEKFNSRQG